MNRETRISTGITPDAGDDARLKSLRMLERWIGSISSLTITPTDRPDLCYYGDGSNGWGVQTTQKAMAALASLVTAPEYDASGAGVSKDELTDTTLRMLRYILDTHLSGDYHTTDGPDTRWGHTWISALGTERMMHAFEALQPFLSGPDKEKMRTLLFSEADWLLENYPVEAGLVKNNRPESNMWNGAALMRCALYYPEAEHRAAYEEKGTRFLLNAISIPADRFSTDTYAGRPLAEWHAGANFTHSYGCNHHGYLNIGYMVITLSNLAMLHFSYRKAGKKAPDALYLHFEDLWRLVRSCIFPDGRLNRIGGDTRVRYCYCQDYLLPTLLLVADKLGEDHGELELGWLRQVEREMSHNGDGSFLSDRCELLVERSPLYFSRLESDRAVSLSYKVLWSPLETRSLAFRNTGEADKLSGHHRAPWHDDLHGACYIRTRNHMASFVWRASEAPQGMALPLCDSSLAEWRYNLAGEIRGDGAYESTRILNHAEAIFTGGFLTCGCYSVTTHDKLAEQISEETIAAVKIVFAALPDAATVIVLQMAQAPKRIHLSGVKGLHLNIPNDIFNNFQRAYRIHGGGDAVVVDGILAATAIYGGPLAVLKSDFRQIGITKKRHLYPTRGMLKCDEICMMSRTEPAWYERGETILDIAAAINTQGQVCEAYRESAVDENVRIVCVRGADGLWYTLTTNFGYHAGKVADTTLPPGGAVLFEEGRLLANTRPRSLQL